MLQCVLKKRLGLEVLKFRKPLGPLKPLERDDFIMNFNIIHSLLANKKKK